MTEATELLTKTRRIEDLEELGKHLGETTAEHHKFKDCHNPAQETVFSMLYMKIDRPTVSKLAEIFEKSNLANEAYKLDSSRKYI